MGWLKEWTRGAPTGMANVLLAALVVGIVAMMLLPLPTFLLDILLTLNIAIAVVLLLVSIYVSTPLRFSVFPSILLITTLYRLGLNVSSTRLILLQADAGEVISSFGGFVVGSNLVVGVVIFLILTVIQFVVIARGSGRVAEVAARFTLDAMPGKQLSIDADLRSGAMDQRQARAARRALSRESQLYGSMDGAMKFVKGDAIAGMLITVVNIVGGLLIGTLQMQMPLEQAARVYSLLTIGDGLVSQIPALLISTAAGVVVTRVASEEEGGQLGHDIGRQVLAHPRAIALAAGLLALLALLPGLPAVPFLLLALLLGALAHHLLRRQRRLDADRVSREPLQQGRPLQPSPITLELGRDHAAYADSAPGGEAQDTMRQLLRGTRELMLRELGVVLPRVRVTLSPELAPRGYRVLLHELPAARGQTLEEPLVLGHRQRLEQLGVTPGDELHLPGLADAAWAVSVEQAARLRDADPPLQLVDAATQITLHLSQLLRLRAAEFLGIQETRDLLDELERSFPTLVSEVVPRKVKLQELAQVLGLLVAEGLPVRDLRLILEALARCDGGQRPAQLAEQVRRAMARTISHIFADEDGTLRAVVLDPSVEGVLRDSLDRPGDEEAPALEPELQDEIVTAVRRSLPGHRQTVLLCCQDLRRLLRRLLQHELPRLPVLSFEELSAELKIERVATVRPEQN